MIFSTVRFLALGWVEKQYLQPSFQFKYFGFYWIEVPSPWLLYLIYAVMLLAAIGVLLGCFYRLSATLFFVSFTYVELLDKTFYLNHYYFISLIAFLMIFLPAHVRLSLDVHLGRVKNENEMNAIYLQVLRLQVATVYFFAGIAKINHDWLIRAMPMRIWLPANAHQPLLGSLFAWKPLAYIFSWFGMVYDTTIVAFLSWKKTRVIAYSTVILFHLLTAWLFPIGVFPIIMIVSALLYFPPEWHEKHVLKFEKKLSVRQPSNSLHGVKGWKIVLFSFFILFQLTFPLRYLVYPGNIFWTEEGYAFSWRVMLMEKAGNAQFFVTDSITGKKIHIYNRDYLIPVQEKMMATRPDFILQYAKMLKEDWQKKGVRNPVVTADVFVTLNGRRSKRFVEPMVDLSSIEDSWKHKKWILEN